MKSKVTLYLVLAINLLLLSANSWAQAWPCNIPAFQCDVAWNTTVETFSLSDCGVGCTVEVLYSWRKCYMSDPLLRDQQLDIRQITYSAECVNCSTNDLQASVLEAILQRNTMQFWPSTSNQCSDQIRLMQAQCMKSYTTTDPFGGSGTRTVLEVCASGGCCTQKLRVCRDIAIKSKFII